MTTTDAAAGTAAAPSLCTGGSWPPGAKKPVSEDGVDTLVAAVVAAAAVAFVAGVVAPVTVVLAPGPDDAVAPAAAAPGPDAAAVPTADWSETTAKCCCCLVATLVVGPTANTQLYGCRYIKKQTLPWFMVGIWILEKKRIFSESNVYR